MHACCVGHQFHVLFSSMEVVESQTSYDISECRYHVKNIPELQDKLLGTCSYGWFVIVDTCSDIHWFYMFRYCFLLNPISTKMIQLLSSWAPHFSYKNCVLSLPPDSPECVVMFFDYESGIHRNHVFCKSGGLVEQAITALFSHALHEWLCWSTYKARILQNI